MGMQRSLGGSLGAWSVAASLLATACGGSGALSSGTSEEVGLGQATLSVESIDFGLADCGGEAPESQTFTLQNKGEGPLRWSASLDSIEQFELSGQAQGTLQPGASATLTVNARPMAASNEAGAVKLAQIAIQTDDPARQLVQIPLRATAQGATLVLVAPSLADFGLSPVGQDAPAIPVTLKNVGNASAKFAFAQPADPQFSFEWTGAPDAVEIAPGATATGVVAKFNAANNKVSSSAGIIEVDGPVCGASASSVALKGQGLSGSVGYSPGLFDLGKVACNTQAPSQLFIVYNTGNLVYAWNAKLKDGKNFTVSPPSGAVKPGESAQITLTPKSIGMTTILGENGLGDTLIFTTSIPGDTAHEVPILQTATGAILKWNATPLDFGTIAAFSESAGKFITVTNEGNAAAAVKVGGSDAIVGTGGSVPGGGGTLISTVKYKATNLGPQTAQMELQTEDPICQPLPAKVAATGAGKGVASQMSVGGYGNKGGGEQGGCIVLKDSGGKVACFGQNSFGQLGTTNTAERGPAVIGGLPEIVQVTSGDRFHCARGKDGTVWCWGLNRNNRGNRTGVLGTMTVESSAVPMKIAGLANVVDVSAGHNMACAVRMDGTAACWGTNRRQNLSTTNTGAWYDVPQELVGITTATQITAGGGGGCVRLNDFTARCWGRFSRGSLGDGDSCRDCQTGFRQVAMGGIAQIVRMSNGAKYAPGCALDSAGNLNCWGCRNYCQVGANGCGGRCRSWYYTPVGNLGGVTQAAAYWWGGCALMNDKTVRCWGRNDDGNVGNGGTGNVCGPQTVQNLAGVDYLAAGGRGACAIVSGGSVKCWGNYGAGTAFTATTLRFF